MKISLSLNTTFDLNGDFEQQIQNLERLKEYIGKEEVSPVDSCETGEMEKLYLKVTGKTRMNHMDKTISREQQAELNLKNLGVSLNENQEESLEENFSYVLPPDEQDVSKKTDDPFC